VLGLPRRPVAAIDLDATISRYHRWRGPDRIGRPIPGAHAALRTLQDKGYRLILFTTRARHGKKPIQAWLKRHGLADYFEAVTATKPPAAVFFDDRAWRVPRNVDGGLTHAVQAYLALEESR
jgi:phosphoglycolate phosphatase-like HAD superfamily hydrolase